jgi:hypothetical protein
MPGPWWPDRPAEQFDMQPVDAEGYEGQSLVRRLAVFTDPHPLPASAYTATVDWGDGAPPEAGCVMELPDGSFAVSGRHSYERTGIFGYAVTIGADGREPASVTGFVSVDDAAFFAGRAFVRATVDRPFARVVARLGDANPAGRPDDFVVTIRWGDGSTSRGELRPGRGWAYEVVGAHAYPAAKAYVIDTEVRSLASGRVATAQALATVVGASVRAHGHVVRTRAGVAYRGPVAGFADSDPSATPDMFEATIDWGDGESSPGEVRRQGPRLAVIGAHAYLSAGTYPVAVTITDAFGHCSVTRGASRVRAESAPERSVGACRHFRPDRAPTFVLTPNVPSQGAVIQVG